MLSYGQAVILGLLQGVTELFPVSSLGHTVLLPALLGWHNLVGAESAKESFYLAFVVALHVGTALGLLLFFWRDWVRIIRGFARTLVTRKIETPDERLAWLLGIATIPAGITALALEHVLRTQFAKPLAASIFLTINWVILVGGELVRRRTAAAVPARRAPGVPAPVAAGSRRLDTLEFKESVVIGIAQTAALLAGVSRSGITMVAGLVRGLNHEDAARFSFLLATPLIFAAGVYKIPDLLGPLGNGVRAQALVSALCALVAAYVSTRFLIKFFQTRSLWPFAIYSLVVGGLCILRFA